MRFFWSCFTSLSPSSQFSTHSALLFCMLILLLCLFPRTILLSVISLLNEPNTFSPANVDASVMYRKWRDSKGKDREYIEIIRYREGRTRSVIQTKACFTVPTQSFCSSPPISKETGAVDQSGCGAGRRQSSHHLGRILRPHSSPTHRRRLQPLIRRLLWRRGAGRRWGGRQWGLLLWWGWLWHRGLLTTPPCDITHPLPWPRLDRTHTHSSLPLVSRTEL